jgi:pteridine reductase
MTRIDLRGKVALVTGSARRVGRAIALELATQGMHQVVHHSGSDQAAEETARDIRALGVEALIVKADLRQPEAIQRLFETVRVGYARLDLLVNSAANFKAQPILEVSLEEWREVLDVNLTAPFLCSQHAARLMREHEGGAIVNILDVGALRPWKKYPHHSVAKTGLLRLTEILALSLAPDIRVNAVSPGMVMRSENLPPEQWARLEQRLPLQRAGEPSDVAQAVAFLAGQPFITGEVLRVDGGEYLI